MEIKKVLFIGKTTMANKDVDIKIYEVSNDNEIYYEWDYNPHLVDVNQIGPHLGGIMLGKTLKEILFHINMYKNDIHEIKEIISNPNF